MVRVRIIVKEVRGFCAAGYKPGDSFILEGFCIIPENTKKLCIHALSAMQTLLYAFSRGVSAKKLGISKYDDIGYIQCPDPGEPYTIGGTVIFELRRELNSKSKIG